MGLVRSEIFKQPVSGVGWAIGWEANKMEHREAANRKASTFPLPASNACTGMAAALGAASI